MAKMVTITIDEGSCTGCALCVDVCPVPCFDFDVDADRPVVIDEVGCLVCRSCEDICDYDAVAVKES